MKNCGNATCFQFIADRLIFRRYRGKGPATGRVSLIYATLLILLLLLLLLLLLFINSTLFLLDRPIGLVVSMSDY